MSCASRKIWKYLTALPEAVTLAAALSTGAVLGALCTSYHAKRTML
jgi:hypothetical protein